VAGDPLSSGRRARRPAPGRLAWLLLLLLIGAGLLALYFRQSMTAPFNSDGAANVLQGQAIVTGNPLLRGWWTSDVSFYTTELPEYALVTAIRGLSPDVVHLCGALTYTLTILLAALVARSGAGRQAGWYRAGLAAGIMLAPSILGGTEVFLENPDHAGTAVPVLLLFLILGRAAGRGGRQAGGHGIGRLLVPAAACVLLALTQVGDELALVAATVPLGAVCGLRLLTARRLNDGERRRAGPLTDGTLLAAALVSVGLAKLADVVIRALGGFAVRPLGGVALAPPHQVPANARLLWKSLILLFGANNPGAPHQPQTIKAHVLLVAMADSHVIGLLLVGAGLTAGIASLLSWQADRVTQLLVAAVGAVLAAGVFTTVLRSLSSAHEVAILLPLGAALAGRVLPEAVRLRPARLRRTSRAVAVASPRPPARRRPASIAPLVLGAWLALLGAELCYAAAWPATPPPQQAVAAWLTSHHDRAGLAGYWQAGATTVTSGGRVLVAPITLAAPGRATAVKVTGAASGPGHRTVAASADRWESSAAWYQPGQHDATFVIAVTDPDAPGGGLSPAAVRASFGPPAAQYQVGQDVIMLYRYNLLTRVRGAEFPGAG
jgi:hypothetical protein